MALNSLFCADVPLSNYSLTHNGQQPVTTLVTRALMLVQCIASWAEGRGCTCLRSYATLAND